MQEDLMRFLFAESLLMSRTSVDTDERKRCYLATRNSERYNEFVNLQCGSPETGSGEGIEPALPLD